MKRHLCTKCRKKRKEKFLKVVRESDKPNSKAWICIDNCSDGRLNSKAKSFLQDRLSMMQEGQSTRSIGLSHQDLKLSNVAATKSDVSMDKFILDVCSANRMFWFNKNHTNVIYADIKSDQDLAKSFVARTIVQDFKNLKYKDGSFRLVVFDPPHLFKKEGQFSWLNDRYGTLHPDHWPMDIKQGFDECMRVLKDYGVLIFKWSEGDISVSTILAVIDQPALFGHTSDKKNKTHWLCFMKIP